MCPPPTGIRILLCLGFASLAGCTFETGSVATSENLEPVVMFEDAFDGAFDPAWTHEGTTLIEGASWGWGTALREASFEVAISMATHRDVTVEALVRGRGADPADAFIVEWFDGTAWHELVRYNGLTRWVTQTWTLPEAEGVEDFRLRFRTSGPLRAKGQVDLVRISAVPVECVHDAACDDGNACTNQACVDYACAHVNLPGAVCPEGHCDGAQTCWASPMVYAVGAAAAEHLDDDGDGVYEAFEPRGGDLLTAQVVRAGASQPASVRRATLEYDLSSVPPGVRIVRAEFDIFNQSAAWLGGLDLDIGVYGGDGTPDSEDATRPAVIADSLHMEHLVVTEDVADVTVALQALLDGGARWVGIRMQLTADEESPDAVSHRVTIQGLDHASDWGRPRLRVFYEELVLTDCEPGTFVAFAGDWTSDRVCHPCPEGEHSTTVNAEGCTAWTTCVAGQYVAAGGTAATDRTCAGCPSGTFGAALNAAACDPWRDCGPGTFVVNSPSATEDRVCAPCAAGTYTSGWNESACLAWGTCPAGTVQTAPGGATMPPVCAPCVTGEYCAGDTALSQVCGNGVATWDHDGNPATACAGRTVCVAGEYVVSDGDATSDRLCATCAEGTFSTATNWTFCVPWSSCNPGLYVSVRGTSTRNQSCSLCPTGTFSDARDASMCTPFTDCAEGTFQSALDIPTRDRVCSVGWLRQFGSEGIDVAEALAVDGDGNAIVAGYTTGALPGETSAGFYDAFLRKYAGDGTLLWTRQFGTSSYDVVHAISVSEEGKILVAGTTSRTLPGQATSGGDDAFLRAYDSDGTLLWTRQFGTNFQDVAFAVSTNSAGEIFVGGATNGAFPGQSSAGDQDAFVSKFTGDGVLLWSRQFGSSESDMALGVAANGVGEVFVVGKMEDSEYDDGSVEGQDAFVRKYGNDGSLTWQVRFGSTASDSALAVSVDPDGNVIVVGEAWGSISGTLLYRRENAFVAKYSTVGSLLWIVESPRSSSNLATAVRVDGAGRVFVAERIDRDVNARYDNAVLSVYAPDGTLEVTREFGTDSIDHAYAVDLDAVGGVIVAGTTQGELPGQTSAGAVDAFVGRMGVP